MKRAHRPVTIAAVAVCVAAVGVTARAVAVPTSHRAASTYHYRARVDQTSGLNGQGVPGKLGRRGTLHAELRAARHPRGAAIGGVELELQTTSTRFPSTILEVGTIQVPGAVVAVQGVQVENRPSTPLTITGATGRFGGRHGTVSFGDNGSVTLALRS